MILSRTPASDCRSPKGLLTTVQRASEPASQPATCFKVAQCRFDIRSIGVVNQLVPKSPNAGLASEASILLINYTLQQLFLKHPQTRQPASQPDSQPASQQIRQQPLTSMAPNHYRVAIEVTTTSSPPVPEPSGHRAGNGPRREARSVYNSPGKSFHQLRTVMHQYQWNHTKHYLSIVTMSRPGTRSQTY